jgi:hypothetical protein
MSVDGDVPTEECGNLGPYVREGLMEAGSPSGGPPWRAIVVAMAISVAVFVVLDSLSSGGLLLTLAFAALYLIGGFLAYRNMLAGFVLLALLFAMDVVFLPFYERSALADWFLQGIFGLLNIIGLIGAIAVLVSRRRHVAYR